MLTIRAREEGNGSTMRCIARHRVCGRFLALPSMQMYRCRNGDPISRGVSTSTLYVSIESLVALYCSCQVICAAFESGLSGGVGRLQDLVHAAWGVYSTGGGEEDALDSLVRIVRLAVQPFQS